MDSLERATAVLQASLGPGHPQVGKAWLLVARASQATGLAAHAVPAGRALAR